MLQRMCLSLFYYLFQDMPTLITKEFDQEFESECSCMARILDHQETRPQKLTDRT